MSLIHHVFYQKTSKNIPLFYSFLTTFVSFFNYLSFEIRKKTLQVTFNLLFHISIFFSFIPLEAIFGKSLFAEKGLKVVKKIPIKQKT